jgi:hypothetical protein
LPIFFYFFLFFYFLSVLQSLAPVEWAPLLVRERYDSNSIWVDCVEEIVGETPQRLPARSPPDQLASFQIC